MPTFNAGNSVMERVAARNGGGIVSVDDMSRWLSSGGCPRDVVDVAAWSVLELYTRDEYLMSDETVRVQRKIHQPPVKGQSDEEAPQGEYEIFSGDPLPHRKATKSTNLILDPHGNWLTAEFVGPTISSETGVSDTDECFTVLVHISHILEQWNQLPVNDRPRDGFPLEILYLAWVKQPKLVIPSSRTTRRIIPSKLAQVAPGDRQAGKLFTVAAHVALLAPESGTAPGQMAFSGLQHLEVAKQQFVLPGFKESTTIGPCLPLALYDLGDAPATSRGPAAPLPLRLFVEAVLAVPMDSRETDNPVAMRVTLRKLLEWLYPSPRKPRPNEYWPRLMAAFEALESPAARIPWYDPDTGQGGLRRIVNITDIPRGPAKLDDLISVIVDLPPGSGNGPQVSDNLRQWGIKSAAGYRALLNLAYRWFEPGRTHFPVGKGRRRFWAQANDPDRYPALTDDELIALCFPNSSRSARRNLLSGARKVIRQLEQADELRIVESKGTLKLLPPEAGSSTCG